MEHDIRVCKFLNPNANTNPTPNHWEIHIGPILVIWCNIGSILETFKNLTYRAE